MNSKIYFNRSWSKTRQGVDIPLWSSISPDEISTKAASEPILFVGGVHGDEPEGVWLAEAFLNWIQTQCSKKKKSFNSNWFKQDWILIPCLNPEGYQQGERTNSQGVDINRNFPSQDWSSEIKAPRYNPGKEPGSEPEVQLVMDVIRIYKPKLIIHFHSWKPCIVYTGKPAESIAQKLSEHSGYPYQEDIGYPTPGSLGQYAWYALQIPVICIEEQEGAMREHIWRRFQWALMDLLQ